MKSALFLLLGILLSLVFLRGTAVSSKKIDIGSLMDSSVALVDLESQHVFCSGVWISGDEILTAAHCVHNLSFINYLDHRDFTSGRFGMRLGEVVSIGSSDLALIRVVAEDHQHSYVSIYSGDVVPGMEGHIIGHPAGQVFTYMRGWVSAIRYRGGIYFLQVQAPVFPGNSGGGLFDDRGRLLGISSSMSLVSPDTGYFVSHREILEFLDSDESLH